MINVESILDVTDQIVNPAEDDLLDLLLATSDDRRGEAIQFLLDLGKAGKRVYGSCLWKGVKLGENPKVDAAFLRAGLAYQPKDKSGKPATLKTGYPRLAPSSITWQFDLDTSGKPGYLVSRPSVSEQAKADGDQRYAENMTRRHQQKTLEWAEHGDAISALRVLQDKGYSIYIVINNGGCTADTIDEIVTHFFEDDDTPAQEQWERFAELRANIPGVFAVAVGDRPHTYIRQARPYTTACNDGEAQTYDLNGNRQRVNGIDTWRAVQDNQNRAIANADRKINDPSRLMRLPGFDRLILGLGANGEVEIANSKPVAYTHRWTGSFAEDYAALWPVTSSPRVCRGTSRPDLKSFDLAAHEEGVIALRKRTDDDRNKLQDVLEHYDVTAWEEIPGWGDEVGGRQHQCLIHSGTSGLSAWFERNPTSTAERVYERDWCATCFPKGLNAFGAWAITQIISAQELNTYDPTDPTKEYRDRYVVEGPWHKRISLHNPEGGLNRDYLNLSIVTNARTGQVRDSAWSLGVVGERPEVTLDQVEGKLVATPTRGSGEKGFRELGEILVVPNSGAAFTKATEGFYRFLGCQFDPALCSKGD